MPKKAVSLTLDVDNLLWLHGQARAAGARSLSEVVDRVVSRARAGERDAIAARSVRGTIRISPDDPDLAHADEAIRARFEVTRPVKRRQRRRAPRRLDG